MSFPPPTNEPSAPRVARRAAAALAAPLALALALAFGVGGDRLVASAEASAELAAPSGDFESEYPSEIWSPYPSTTWSPRVVTASPRLATESSPGEAALWPLLADARSGQSVFDPPPTAESGPAGDSASTPGTAMMSLPGAAAYDAGGNCFESPPLVASDPPTAGPPGFAAHAPAGRWRPQSHFLPSLGRYGLVAPRTPGVESVHSPYVVGQPWGPPVQGPSAWVPRAFAPPPPLHGGYGDPPCADGAHGTGDGQHGGPGHAPAVDPRAGLSPYSSEDFTPDPYFDLPYDGCAEQDVYVGKYLNPTQRPLVEWGMPLYLNGPVPPPLTPFGESNPSLPRFYVYGDYRSAAAYNEQNGQSVGVLAHRLNLELDLWLTSTERIHMFTGPFQDGGDFMRFEFDDGRGRFFDEIDFFSRDTDTLFFEGDLGYIVGGLLGTYAPFDMPITAGLIPLLFQNGVWMEDAILGMAVTLPARNNPRLDWSNYDVTFFFGVDQVTSPAFAESDSAANLFGATTFIEAKGGYLEAGYAFLDDTSPFGRSYHNVGISYTRRYLNLVSNSMRLVLNAGQEGPQSDRSADGVLLIAENSFLTPWPYNVIPYVNLFAGFDRPQSAARAGSADGVLRNTGILFESDNLTGYPTLDATANDTCGAAVGLDLLAPEFTHQLILEAAVVRTLGDSAGRNAAGDQFGLGVRYQVPISNAHLLRFDVMHGWLDNAEDVAGARAEFRWKF